MVAKGVRGRGKRKEKKGVRKGGSFFLFSQKFFSPPIDEFRKRCYIMFAIGSEELSRRMEKRASV